jgi:tRNA G37 N-methylase Trm5
VLSFEMQPTYFEVVRANIAANGLEKTITPILGEVSADAGSVDSAVERFGLQRFDFLKIDVDGADFGVLRGAVRSLKRFHPVVVVEMTRNQDEIYAFLRDEVGYTTLAGMSGEPVDRSAWPPNLIAANGPVEIPPPGHFRRR